MRVLPLLALIVVPGCVSLALGQAPGATGGVSVRANAKSMPKIESRPAAEREVSSDVATCTIVLRAVFDKKGKVTHTSFIEAKPEQPNGCSNEEVKTFKKKSIDAARKIKFIPAMKDGQPVSMWMQLEYNFSLGATKKK